MEDSRLFAGIRQPRDAHGSIRFVYHFVWMCFFSLTQQLVTMVREAQGGVGPALEDDLNSILTLSRDRASLLLVVVTRTSL